MLIKMILKNERWQKPEHEGMTLHERAERVYSWWVEDIKEF